MPKIYIDLTRLVWLMMNNKVPKGWGKRCSNCKHFRELGHVAHFCHAKDAVMANSRAQLCANYMVVEEEETVSRAFVVSRH